MGLALNRLGKEDPSFRYSRDEETGQTTIEGKGKDVIVLVYIGVYSRGVYSRGVYSVEVCLSLCTHYTHS